LRPVKQHKPAQTSLAIPNSLPSIYRTFSLDYRRTCIRNSNLSTGQHAPGIVTKVITLDTWSNPDTMLVTWNGINAPLISGVIIGELASFIAGAAIAMILSVLAVSSFSLRPILIGREKGWKRF
jgi:hypothetical protein